MDEGLKMVIGMSLAYVTSFAGLILAYISYKRRRNEPVKKFLTWLISSVLFVIFAFLTIYSIVKGFGFVNFLIPTLVFGFSFVVTYALYKHFTKQLSE